MQPIFIQIPRTGSGSINSILNQTGGHRPASWYKQKYPELWADAYKFAIVRNPYDRYASILGHFSLETPPDVVLKPQTWYIDEELDFIGKYEDLASSWTEISAHLGITTPLPHLNASQKPPLTPEQMEWVVGEWGSDFDRFGYKKATP